jgi:hypothetical protein
MRASFGRLAVVAILAWGAAALAATGEEEVGRGEVQLRVARGEPVAPAAPACQAKGGDGAACSSDEECTSGKCEGGSCCTKHEDPCDSSSHCCGHQSCVDGKCP